MKLGAPVAALAAAVALPSLANGFVYDDVLIIQQNPLVHGLSHSAAFWHSSYWPAGLLYRPLTLQLFALEWTLGGGHAWPFHLVNLLCYAVTAFLVWRLAARLLPEAGERAGASIAGLAAAAFALHPVHVEAVANVVGQSELLATGLIVLAVERYVAWRKAGELPARRRLLLAGVTLLAMLAKETGYVAPLLLVAADLTVLRTISAGAHRREVYLLQAAALVTAGLLRLLVLGSLAGESAAMVWQGWSMGGRAIAMLAVVPEWIRLLLWPAHLQAEYGPPALSLSGSLDGVRLLGLLLLLLGLLVLAASWRRRPLVAFGLLWIGCALVPVSNVLAPTGIVLAERALFLPSVGLALVLAALLAWLAEARGLKPRAMVWAVGVGAMLLLLGLAALRSITRNRAWRSQQDFFAAVQRDAPRSYRAHFIASRYYYGERRYPEAERAASRALALYPYDPQVHEQLGQVLRVQGRCGDAVPVLREGVRLAPERTTARSRLIECALAVGDSATARAAAQEAVQLGQTEFATTLRRLSP